MTQTPPTMTVHKYPLPIPEGPPGTLGRVVLPAGAAILKIGSQLGPDFVVRGAATIPVAPSPEFYLWAIVCTTEEQREQRRYVAVETGQEFSAEALVDPWVLAASDGKPTPFARSETVLAMGGRHVVHFLLSHPGAVS